MPPSPDFGEISPSSTIKQTSFYEVLGVSPKSSQMEIRDAYRRKSKQYHPDTAVLEKNEAAKRFQALKQAYETLRFPDKRKQYDELLAKSQVSYRLRSQVNAKPSRMRTSASLDPEDRALSAGEIFALFILGVTFLFCLLVALFLGISRGEMLVQSIPQDSSLLHQIDAVKPQAGAKTTNTGKQRNANKSTLPHRNNASPHHSSQPQRPLFPPPRPNN